MVCRTGKDFNGPWGPPLWFRSKAGVLASKSEGATDFVILDDDRGANSLLHSKVNLGADAFCRRRPERTHASGIGCHPRSELLTYSRARGAFAGVSLEGSTLRPDNDGNRALYGKPIDPTAVITGHESGGSAGGAHADFGFGKRHLHD